MLYVGLTGRKHMPTYLSTLTPGGQYVGNAYQTKLQRLKAKEFEQHEWPILRDLADLKLSVTH
jgi:hypothetical protein